MWYGCTHVLEFLPKVSIILDSRVSLHKTLTVAVESTTTSRSMQGSGPCQISRGSTTVAAGMHVTDRRRQEPGKPITCQRDPNLTIPSCWQQSTAWKSYTQLHRKRSRKKFDEPYPKRCTPVTRQQSIRKRLKNERGGEAPCSTKPGSSCALLMNLARWLRCHRTRSANQHILQPSEREIMHEKKRIWSRGYME
jgi:hypothetical protein